MNILLAVVRVGVNLHQSLLVRRANLLVLGPVGVRVVQERCLRFGLELLFELLLADDLVFRDELLLLHVRHQVEVQLDQAEAA